MATIDNHIFDPDVIHVSMIGGPAGSGKSTLARRLVELTDFDLTDKDIVAPLVEALLVEMGSTADDRQSSKYKEKVRPLEYKFMKQMMLQSVSLGRSIIADAPFGQEFADEVWRCDFEQECVKAAHGKPVAFHYISVHVDDNVLKNRLSQRNEPRDAEKLRSDEKWAEFLAGVRALKPAEPCTRIDCSKDGEKEITASALKVIEAFHLMAPAFSSRPRNQRTWHQQPA